MKFGPRDLQTMSRHVNCTYTALVQYCSWRTDGKERRRQPEGIGVLAFYRFAGCQSIYGIPGVTFSEGFLIRGTTEIFRASLLAQMVNSLPAVRETWVQSLGWEDLEEGMATHSSILAWRSPRDRGVWRATAHEVTKSQTQLNV